MAVITDRRRRLLLLKKKLLLCMLANKTRRRFSHMEKEEGGGRFSYHDEGNEGERRGLFQNFHTNGPMYIRQIGSSITYESEKVFTKGTPVASSMACYNFEVPTEDVWKEAAHGYGTIWQFRNCCGTVDGKHVLIQQPAKSGSLFYNYKGTNSIVLLAVVDPHYAFLEVDIGAYGSQSDGGIFKSSTTENLPTDSILPRSNIKVPHVFLGDEAFQLTPNFLRPFPRDSLDNKKRVFNYRLSRARGCSENAFALLASRWRIYRRPILAKPENVDLFVKATVILHNFLYKEEQKLPDNYRFYSPAGYVDFMDTHGIHHTRGTWETEMHNSSALVPMTASQARKYSNEAAYVRESFSNYFMSPAGGSGDSQG